MLEVERIVPVNDDLIECDFNFLQDLVERKILLEEINSLLHNVLVFGRSLKIANQQNSFVLELCQFLKRKHAQILLVLVRPFVHQTLLLDHDFHMRKPVVIFDPHHGIFENLLEVVLEGGFSVGA